MTNYREHPLKVLRYSAKNIWLLLFPLLRGIGAVWTDKNWFYNWLRGAWMDILVIGIIIVFGYIRWYCSYITVTDSYIRHNEGIFIKVSKQIPFSSISSVTVERAFYLMPFKAVRVRCDTSAGIFDSADMKMMISDQTCGEIIKRLPHVRSKTENSEVPKPTALSIILFSIFFSSGFSGTIYIAALFFHGGNIARDIISRSLTTITEETEKHTEKFIYKIPDAAVVIAVFFLSAWLLSFIINLLRYSRFELKSDDKYLYTSYGVFTKRAYTVFPSQINYIDIRQNLIMKIFGAVAVHISCSGYGAGKHSLPVLHPVHNQKKMSSIYGTIGIAEIAPNEYRPKWTGLWQHIWQPTLIGAGLIPMYYITMYFFPDFYGLTKFSVFMLEIPAVWFVIVKIAAFFTSGIAIYDDKILVRCCKWSKFHTLIVDRSKIIKVELEQTIFQKIGKRCSVSLWFEGEKHIKYKVKAFDEQKALDIAELLGYEVCKEQKLRYRRKIG